MTLLAIASVPLALILRKSMQLQGAIGAGERWRLHQAAETAQILVRDAASTPAIAAPGAFTGVRVRGAEAEQLLVILDGVRVSDPAAPGGGFDFANLSAGNLAKIDLLRGSNSTIWGSDASRPVATLWRHSASLPMRTRSTQ